MVLSRLCDDIFKPENRLLSEALILNITSDDCKTLAETLKKLKERSTCLKKEKILALILAKRFEFLQHPKLIKNIILPASGSKTITNFIDKVLKDKFEQALKLNAVIAAKIDSNNAPVRNSTAYPLIYNDLDQFVKAIKSTRDNPFQQINDDWKQCYLDKPGGLKKKTGQDNFLALWSCLIFDLEVGVANLDDISWYATLVLNLYMHNASYRPPVKGYGKAQQREMDCPNLYFRSQNKHSVSRLFKALTTDNKAEQCLLPRNEDTFQLLRQNTTDFTLNLAKYDVYGYVMPNQQVNAAYFSLPLAYSGLRSNIYVVTAIAIDFFLSSQTPLLLVEKINKELFIPANQKYLKFSPWVLQERIVNAQEVVRLMPTLKNEPYYPNLYADLTNHRHDTARQLIQLSDAAKFKRIHVAWDSETTCLEITFYNGKAEDSENYSEGVTNVIINFFVALLNHYLKLAGFFIHVDRRQSFGFNRITITNTTNMCMRVSLGYEPVSFNPIFLKALSSLDVILDQNNFLDKTTETLKEGFKVVEKPRKGEITDKTGIQFLKFMRAKGKSLASINVAQNALEQAPKEVGYEQQAFCQYINFIASKDPKLPELLPSLTVIDINETHSSDRNILVMGLLRNLLKITSKTINESILINPQFFIHSYWASLFKLIKFFKKGLALMESHTDYPESHIYNKVLSLVDDICEHLILLRALIYIMQPKAEHNEVLTKLKKREIAYASKMLQLAPHHQIDLFFTDNGQQALTTCLAVICQQINGVYNTASLNEKIHASKKCYFEFGYYLNQNLKLKYAPSAAQAEIIYLDIRDLKDNISLAAIPKAKAVIIDNTHQPLLTTQGLSQYIHDLLNKGIWVVIASSLLKHEQVGLDKFQAGKLIILSPPGKQLDNNLRNSLDAITKNAMHPIVSIYFQTMNKICRDKYALFPKVSKAGQLVEATNNVRVFQAK